MNDIVRQRDSRTRILQAASAAFLSEGFERTSVDGIAAAVRMSKQSIYELFPSKLVLFEAAVRSTLDDSLLNLTAVPDSGEVEETLARYALRLFEGFVDPVNFGLFRANMLAGKYCPELATELHERRLAAAQPLADYLGKLLREGKIGPCDVPAITIRFGGLVVEGARYFLGRPLPDADTRTRIVKQAVNLYLHGYRSVQNGPGEAALPAPIEPPEISGSVALRLSPQKVAALVDAATAEFLNHGYQRARIDRIAAAVHVSKATIYRQFGSKEKLLRHVIQCDIFEADRPAERPDPLPDHLEAALAALARQALDRHLAPSSLLMHRLLLEEVERVPDLAQSFYELRVRRLGSALCAILREFDQPPPADAATHAFYLLATFAVRFMTSTDLPDASLRDQYSREAAWLFLNGIGARSKPPTAEADLNISIG